MYAIDWAHKVAGLEPPSNHLLAKSIVYAGLRVYGKPVVKKEPVTPQLLSRLVSSYSCARKLTLYNSTTLALYLGPVHVIPGQLIAPGQLTDPGVSFGSVHGLTLVTVHMSFSLPQGNFERRITRCTTPCNPPCRGNFSPCEQSARVAPGQE